MNFKHFFSFVFCIVSIISTPELNADLVEDARKNVIGGNYSLAATQLDEALAKNPALLKDATFSYLKGVTEFYAGNFDSSKTLLEASKNKGNGLANLYLGKIAFLDYDFDSARDYYDAFINYRKKRKEPAGEEVEESIQQLQNAENALTRVEKIMVIDSISVGKEKFFKHYRLPSSAGYLVEVSELPFKVNNADNSMAFLSEEGDYAVWNEPDSIGNLHIVESRRLLGDEWTPANPLESLDDSGRNVSFPFVSSDGTTLYFAADGDASIGGYDIFVAQREGIDGDFLSPLNVGMPFNSPYDDYMMALDEVNGIGWWATDRNQLGDKLTIYVYSLNDIRKNYDEHEPDLIDRALLKDYHYNQTPEVKKYQSLIANLKEGNELEIEGKVFFKLPLKNGGFALTPEDLKKPEAVKAARAYLDALKKLDKKESTLSQLRKRYSVNKADNVREEIEKIESEIEKEREDVESLKIKIYKNL